MAQTAGVLRRGPDRIIAGVCAGLANYFGVDPVFVRVVFVLLGIFHGIGILIYLLLWLLMEPSTGQAATGLALGQRLRSMADDIREDFRTGFSRSQPSSTSETTAAGGMPADPQGTPPYQQPARQRGLWVGVVLILLGAYFLFDNLGFLNWVNWGVVWPVVVIAIGVFLLLRQRW